MTKKEEEEAARRKAAEEEAARMAAEDEDGEGEPEDDEDQDIIAEDDDDINGQGAASPAASQPAAPGPDVSQEYPASGTPVQSDNQGDLTQAATAAAAPDTGGQFVHDLPTVFTHSGRHIGPGLFDCESKEVYDDLEAAMIRNGLKKSPQPAAERQVNRPRVPGEFATVYAGNIEPRE